MWQTSYDNLCSSNVSCSSSYQKHENYSPIVPKFSVMPITANTPSSSLSPNIWVPRDSLNLNKEEREKLPRWVTIKDSVQPPIVMQPCKGSVTNIFSHSMEADTLESSSTLTANPTFPPTYQYCTQNFSNYMFPIQNNQFEYNKKPYQWFMSYVKPCKELGDYNTSCY